MLDGDGQQQRLEPTARGRATTAARDLPTGTVTFLFTDIEGSTRLLQAVGERYAGLLAEHDRLLGQAFRADGGRPIATEGDSFFVVFDSAPRAVAACVAAQRAIAGHPLLAEHGVRVRMGLHTGEGILAVADYVGIDVHRAARIAAAGHGGQVLLSEATRGLVADALPPGVGLRDLGEHRLKDLTRAERIYQLVIPGLLTEFPPLNTLERRANNLPVQLTSFVGREHEVAEAKRLLATSRLLTFTGPGGTGKTRLSLQVAAEASDDFADGVFFVPLAPISDPELVPSTIAQVLGVQETAGVPLRERLLDYLREKQLLLVLDNFEQVTQAGPFVIELLRAAPRLKVIVTSRAVLHLYGEQELPVPPLRLPDPKQLPPLAALSQYEAVSLFIQRAVAAKPDFEVTNETAPAVAELCARLDGLPLAIELAAARVKLLPPQAILARLQNRLSLLGSGARDLPARQQTLRGAIAWSYDLLDPSQRLLMARLGVFVGGCSLEAAEAVCGSVDELGVDVLDGLSALVDQSLLRQEEHHGEPRFLMLETIREFAVEKLAESGEIDEMRRRHAGFFLALAERAEPHLLGTEQARWLDELEHEHDNFRAALGWACEKGEVETALRLVAAVWRFWQIRGHLYEGRQRVTDALALPGAQEFVAARARALEAAGGIWYWQGDLERARPHYEEALALQRELGDKAGIARGLYNLSFTYLIGISPDEARADPTLLDEPIRLLNQGLELYREIGDARGIANCLWALGSGMNLQGDLPGARQKYVESLALFRERGDRFMSGWALYEVGLADLKLGNLSLARRSLEEALSIFADSGDRSGMVLLLDAFSALTFEEGDPERAVRLAGAAHQLKIASGTDLLDLSRRLAGYERTDDRLDGETAARLRAEGQRMTPEEAVEYALGRAQPGSNPGAGSGGQRSGLSSR